MRLFSAPRAWFLFSFHLFEKRFEKLWLENSWFSREICLLKFLISDNYLEFAAILKNSMKFSMKYSKILQKFKNSCIQRFCYNIYTKEGREEGRKDGGSKTEIRLQNYFSRHPYPHGLFFFIIPVWIIFFWNVFVYPFISQSSF